MNKYKAAIIGCGRIGCGYDDDPKRKNISTHAGAYSKNKNIELVALSDIDTNKLEKYSKKFNVPKVYTDYKKMLRKEKPDIVSVCTLNDTHYNVVVEAVNSGVKAIFCEKPISDNLKKAKKMVDLCKKRNVLLLINHSRRFDKNNWDIKKFIEQGRLGKIEQVSFYYTNGIYNSGSHMFDLLRFFFGEVDWIQATKSETKPLKIEDSNYDGILKFKNDIFCTIQSLDIKSYLIFEMLIFGTEGMLKITNSGFKVEHYKSVESRLFSGYKELSIAEDIFDSKPKEMMVNAVNHLVNCLNDSLKPVSSGFDGLKTLQIIESFKDSANKNGKKIYLK